MNKKTEKLIRRYTGKKTISPMDSLHGDLGIDSLGMVQLMLDIEDEFEITLGDSDLNPNNLIRVSDVCALVERYTAES